jgi:hypothetical protein
VQIFLNKSPAELEADFLDGVPDFSLLQASPRPSARASSRE